MAQKRHNIQVSQEILDLVKASADETGKTMSDTLAEMLGVKDATDVQSLNPTKAFREKNPWASKPPDTISDAIILCAWREEARAYRNDDVQSFFNEYDYSGFLDKYEGSEPWNKEGYGLRDFKTLHNFHWFAMKKESPFTTSKAVEKISWYGLYKKGLFKQPFMFPDGDVISGTTDPVNQVGGGSWGKNKYYKLIETRIAYLIRNKIIERNNKGTYKLQLDSLNIGDWTLLHGLSLLPPSKAYRLPSIADLISR